MPAPADPTVPPPVRRRPRKRTILAAIAALVVLWIGAGLRRVPTSAFGVLESRWLPLAPSWSESGWVLAPPRAWRLRIVPRGPQEWLLPEADQVELWTTDGRRFGFRGWATLEPEPDGIATIAQAFAGDVDTLLRRVAEESARGLDIRGERPTPPVVHRFESALARGLGERGMRLVRLELDAFDFLDAAPGVRFPVPETKLLVIGLDGADWEILDPLLDTGRLPNLSRLIEGGVRARLLSISPLLSPVIWTSIATGVEPMRHGVLDFLVAQADGSGRQPVTSAQRKVPTIWEILSRVGVEVGVVGWWASWPADPVRGYLVSDRLAYQLFGYRSDADDARGKTWPPELYSSLSPWIVDPRAISDDRVQGFIEGPPLANADWTVDERERIDGLRTALASGDSYTRVATELRSRYEPRLELVYLEGTDTVAHMFMPFRPPLHGSISQRGRDRFGAVVDRYYVEADRLLGRLLAGRGEGWTVLVVSDHGFASDATRPTSSDSRIGHGAAADWHRKYGILVLSGASIRREGVVQESRVYDLAPTILALFGQPIPRSWPGRVLGEVLTPEFLARHPVRYRDDDFERAEIADAGFGDPGAAELLAKLESLGYVGSAGETAASSRNNAAVALLGEGKLEEAERELRAGLQESPNSPMLLVNLGLCLRLADRPEEAVTVFEQALASPIGWRGAAGQLALLRAESGQIKEALRIVREALTREPDASELHDILGQILFLERDTAGAETAWRRAAELDPASASPRNHLGAVARERGDLDAAEAWFLAAIEADPAFLGAYNNLALVHQQRGERQRAIELYDRALVRAPDHPIVLNNLASLYFAEGAIDKARELWQRLVDLKPQYASPLNNLAGVELVAGNVDAAESLLRRALALDPDYGDARINLAIAHQSRGQVDLARKELDRAVQDSRATSRAWFQRARLEIASGDPVAGFTAMRRSLAAAPRPTPELLNGLGDAAWRAGDPESARDAWSRSLALAPNQFEISRRLAESRQTRSPFGLEQ